MVSCCDHISKSLSWFTAGSLRYEIISQSCQNISLLLLWGHYGLTPKSSLSNSEGLIYLLPAQILLHLFWHDQELLSQAMDTVTLQSRHCHVHVTTAVGGHSLGAGANSQAYSTIIHLMLKFSVQKGSDVHLTPWTMKTASQRSRHQPLPHHELLWDSEVSTYSRDQLKQGKKKEGGAFGLK